MRNTLSTYLLIVVTFIGVHLIFPYPFPLLLPEWLVLQINAKTSLWRGIGGLAILITLYSRYSALEISSIFILYLIWYILVIIGQYTLQSLTVFIQISSIFVYFFILVILQYQAIYGIIEIRNLAVAVLINGLLYGILHIYRTQNDWLEEFLQG